MILELKMRSTGSESLRRPAKYSDNFPLKKRRIKYEEEIDADYNLKESTESRDLEISEPENLSTKPQDLKTSNLPPNKVIILKSSSLATNNGGINTENLITSQSGINFHNHLTCSTAKELLPTKYSRPLEPIRLNSPTHWSPPNPFISYNCHSQSQLQSNPYPYCPKAGIDPRLFKMKSERNLPATTPPYSSQQPYRNAHPVFTEVKREVMSPLELRNIDPELQNDNGIKKEMVSPRIPPRDSVISHSHTHHFPNFGLRMTHHHCDNLNRSSCDSGVSSPSGSSTESSTSPPSLTPTLVGGSLRYSCPTCQKSYSTLSGLSKHVQFHCASQNPKSFICKDCDKVYTSLGALKMHIRTHTLPCKCNVCGKAFSRPWLLQGHIRTHTGEKPFGCEHCQRAFADRSNLRAHLQTHSELKKYSCKQCAKTFSRMSLLAKHQDTGCSTHSN